jgi:hypothetical protein
MDRLFANTQLQHLRLSALVSVQRDTLEAKLPGARVNAHDIVDGRIMREVDLLDTELST